MAPGAAGPEIPEDDEADAVADQLGLARKPVDPILLRVARLWLGANRIAQDCRLRNHSGEKRLGDGKANYCVRCLKTSRLALDKIGEALNGLDSDPTEKAIVSSSK